MARSSRRHHRLTSNSGNSSSSSSSNGSYPSRHPPLGPKGPSPRHPRAISPTSICSRALPCSPLSTLIRRPRPHALRARPPPITRLSRSLPVRVGPLTFRSPTGGGSYQALLVSRPPTRGRRGPRLQSPMSDHIFTAACAKWTLAVR